MPIIDIEYSHLVIIGNGFDLNLNLPTSYSNFIQSSEFNDLLAKNNKICKFLHEKYQLQNWIDVENELKIITGHFDDNAEKEFYNLCDGLKKYLGNLDYSKINKGAKAYEMIKEVVQHKFLILDFNYTKTTQLILEELGVAKQDIEERLIKIHGTITDEIIFGVEDKAKILPKHIFLKKSFNKSFKAINLREHLEAINELYIFGHSLGETDHMYFKNFFMSSASNRSSELRNINLYHYGDNSYRDLMIQIDELCLKNLTGFRQNNNLIPIDTSK